MARLLVGLTHLHGTLESYKKRFDLVELHPVDASIPKESTLRGWRRSVPPGFVFSVVLPRVVGELAPSAALDEALEASVRVATAVEARCIVLPTPASVRPTAQNRRRLAAVLAKVPRDGVAVCWEPSGIWEHEDILATAKGEGAIAVLDAARDDLPGGPIAYTRLRSLGKGAALGAASLERAAARLRGRREAFVVVEGAAGEAFRVKTALTAALARSKGDAGGPLVIRPASAIPLVAEDEEQ
jgi:uncharacterized protein YecE (DUF72 family)